MVWPPDVAYMAGLDFFDAVVRRVDAGRWDVATPCARWRAADVLGHVGLATAYGTELLRGGRPEWQPQEQPASAIVGAPGPWWLALSVEAREVMIGTETSLEVDTAAGRRSVADGLRFPTVDLFVHGWDLARSQGLEVEIPGEAITFATAFLSQLPEQRLRDPSVFAEERAVATPTPTEALVAWTGRDPAWSPAPP